MMDGLISKKKQREERTIAQVCVEGGGVGGRLGGAEDEGEEDVAVRAGLVLAAQRLRWPCHVIVLCRRVN